LEIILVILIVALLNGCLIFIDGMLNGIVPIALYAERYMALSTGVDIVSKLTDVMFTFGVSVIVLKFLKKGFETYILWTEGDADEEPFSLLMNFIKAMVVAISFPTVYGWLGTIVENLTTDMINAIGQATQMSFADWTLAIGSAGLVTAIFGLIFVVCFFMLYFQFLMRGLELMILRIGVPLACVGLLDNDKGIFKAYSTKFFQSTLAVVVQICLSKLGVGLMLNMNVFWGVACMILAIKTPKFLNEFILSTGSGSSGMVNNIYQSVRLVGLLKNTVKN